MNPLNKILILYGSETGTAQEVAEGIWRNSKRFGFNGPVAAMDEYEISKLIFEPLIIFVCSTTGQGDPPENMRKFWKFLLRKSLPSHSLSNSSIAVLGLGDSSYAKFNFAAKKLLKRLVALGAKPIIDIGLCDDQHDYGLDAVLTPWTEKLWSGLESFYPHVKEARKEKTNKTILFKWKANTTNGLSTQIDFPPGEPQERVHLHVYDNVRVTTEQHFQDVRLITLKPEKDNLNYSPGAVAYIRPCNSREAVHYLLSLVEHINSTNFQLESIHLPLPVALRNKVLSLKDVMTVYWDLNAVPRRYVFEILAAITENKLEKEKLEEFLSPGGLEELYTYCNRPKRNIVEVLADFPYATARLQLDHLFEIFQPIRPRAYSISSSIEYDGHVVQLLVAVVKYKTRLSTPRLGLASNWIASLRDGPICVAVKPPTLLFPKNVPVVMVGPGTGIAPFRSYVSQRVAKSLGEGDSQRLPMVVIFGSRYEKCDFHFGNELLKWHASNDIFLITAFSRDQPQKVYVQDKIHAEGKQIFQTIYLDKGYIFVAGSSNDMPLAVKSAFIKILSEHSDMTPSEAETYVQGMEASGRYQEETWS